MSGSAIAPGSTLSDARCPDGGWSKFRVRRCKLAMGHTGPHEYEIRDLDAVVRDGMKVGVEPQEYGGVRFLR